MLSTGRQEALKVKCRVGPFACHLAQAPKCQTAVEVDLGQPIGIWGIMKLKKRRALCILSIDQHCFACGIILQLSFSFRYGAKIATVETLAGSSLQFLWFSQ